MSRRVAGGAARVEKEPAGGMNGPGIIEAVGRSAPRRRRLGLVGSRSDMSLAVALLCLLPLGLLTPGFLAGCTRVGVAVGAGAAVGTAASSERGLVTTIDDDRIWLEINQAWLHHDADMFEAAKLQVHEGRVLLSGLVADPNMRVEAVRLAWQVDGVKEVINEIEVSDEGDFGGFLQDRWIVGQLRNKILFDKEVRSINYSIESVAGTVYLMGLAQSQAEAQRVIDHARDIPYVRRVVSHVRLKDDPARHAAAGTGS
jgi:osmotically-inducible protein OsmY